MNKEDMPKFAVIMNWLAEKFPKEGAVKKVKESDLIDYYHALKDLHIEGISFSAKEYFKRTQFARFPIPGELRSLAAACPKGLLPQLQERKLLESKEDRDRRYEQAHQNIKQVRIMLEGLEDDMSKVLKK